MSRSDPRRSELAVAVALCLLGAVVVVLAVGRTWAELPYPRGELLPDRRLRIAGSELVPGVRALGIVGLAGVVALAATRRRGRTVVGLLLAVAGCGVGVATVRAVVDLEGRVARTDQVLEAVGAGAVVDGTAWPWVTVVGGVLLLLAGVLVTVHGRSWAALSARYELPVATGAPAPEVDPSDKALWDELDRGADPTQR